jgi:hypothetical protein
MSEEKLLLAYHESDVPHLQVTPGARWRDWINSMEDRWANRCLPLLMANQAGWTILNQYAFEAVWDGGAATESTTVRFDLEDVGTPAPVQSHFGYGIVTWAVPFLFRTPPGWNLLARGPANWPKDGISALEGLVETDWSIATFTMNWKLTRPMQPVRFEADEPFCMVVPQRRGELESFVPRYCSFAADAGVREATKAWSDSRHEAQVRKFLATYSREYAGERDSWQQHYFRGVTPDGDRPSPTHQTQIGLAEFEDGS